MNDRTPASVEIITEVTSWPGVEEGGDDVNAAVQRIFKPGQA